MKSLPKKITLHFPKIPASDNSRTIDAAIAALILMAVVLWQLSLPLMDPDEMNDLGLASILPWTYWIGLALLSLGFSLSFHPSSRWPGLQSAALVVLILMLHATPPIVYGTLRYSWAWKHIGIVDFIQRHGEVDRTLPFLAAYHNWPGFFWVSAKLANLFDLDPLQIARLTRFVPVLSTLIYVILLNAIFRQFTKDVRVIWAALWFFVCANWVGQDYYSPQALAYGLHLLVLALCLGPLMPTAASCPEHKNWLIRSRTQFAYSGMVKHDVGPQRKFLALLVVFSAAIAIVASHQLTPLVLIISLLGLSIVSPLSFGFAAFVALAFVFWVIFPAAPFTAENLPKELADLGQTFDGVTDKMVDTSKSNWSVALVAWAGRVLSAGMILMATYAWFRRYRKGANDRVLAVLIAAPVFVLGVTSYGGEAIFRIYFFCLPYLALFAATLFFSTKNKMRALSHPIGFAVLIFAMAVGFLLGNNGKDRQYRFSSDEVEAVQWLYARSVPDTLLVEGARSYPSQFMNYENYTYVPISNERRDARDALLADPDTVLTRWFSDPNWQDGYLILTRSQKAYLEALGKMPVGALDQLELDLMASPNFLLVFANKDARIFTARRFVVPSM